MFNHKHKWQVRGQNRWGTPTYRVCLSCRQPQKWEGGLNGEFVDCEPIPELDNQFDENNNFIFSS